MNHIPSKNIANVSPLPAHPCAFSAGAFSRLRHAPFLDGHRMRRNGFAHSAASSLFLALCFAAPWCDVLAAEQAVPNAGVILQQARIKR